MEEKRLAVLSVMAEDRQEAEKMPKGHIRV